MIMGQEHLSCEVRLGGLGLQGHLTRVGKSPKEGTRLSSLAPTDKTRDKGHKLKQFSKDTAPVPQPRPPHQNADQSPDFYKSRNKLV